MRHGVFTSEVYFEGAEQDAIREGDPVYQGRRNKELLIVGRPRWDRNAKPALPNDPGAMYCNFDISYPL